LKISIITPSFNQGRYIERTIQSVLTQSVANFELEYRVIDGGSQDETVSILKCYAKDLHFVSEPDQGQAAAVNKGLQSISGDIIGWLNSDDIYYPNALQKIANFFLAHPKADVVYGDAEQIDQEDRVIAPYPTEAWNIERLKQTCYLSQPAVFWRRSVLEKFGLLDEQLHYCMDYEYWLRLALGGAQFSYFPVVLAGSRLHPATKTWSAPLQATVEALGMLHHYLRQIPPNWLINYAVLLVKTRTRLRFPTLRFMLAVWGIAAYEGLRQHGWLKGLILSIKLPFTMIKMALVKQASHNVSSIIP
jgi:glycosyltransferase involved in cell wall biosynthesis